MSRIWFLLAVLLSLGAGSLCNAASSPSRFDRDRDTLAFQNDTFWAYETTSGGQVDIQSRATPPPYTRHCLVMTRAVLQFRKFALFDPQKPKVSNAEYRKIVRKISRIPVWSKRQDKLVIPGYRDLRAFSEAHTAMLQKELGIWWPTYWRIGNWRMAEPFPRAGQRAVAVRIAQEVRRGDLPAVFLTRFHPLNHVVLPYAAWQRPGGDILFPCYDPNSKDAPVLLRFDAKSSSFYWPKTGYWPGGRVNAFLVYRSFLR